jgi:hypothetical protein
VGTNVVLYVSHLLGCAVQQSDLRLFIYNMVKQNATCVKWYENMMYGLNVNSILLKINCQRILQGLCFFIAL